MSNDSTPAPVQHEPAHRQDVFDPRHPAASSFAVAQPGAGVVADDAHAKDQNLAGGPPATEAEQTYADQREVLQDNHDRDLRVATNHSPVEDQEPEKTPAAASKHAKPAVEKTTAEKSATTEK